MTQLDIHSPIMTIHKKNLTKRIIATLIDYMFYFALCYLYIDHFGHDNDEGEKTVEGLLVLPIFLVWFLYFVVVESIYSATLGHNFLYLKVVTEHKTRIHIGHSLKRHVLDPIDIFMFGIPGLIIINSTEKHQRAGDLWAKTLVVDAREAL